MEERQSDNLEEKPPFFKNWTGLYRFVLFYLLVIILFFYLLTLFYHE